MAHPHIQKVLPQLLKSHFTEPIIQKHITNIIGYGSGVFPQHRQLKNNTIDLIILTKNSQLFHRDFFQQKPSDYEGFSKMFGSSYIAFLNKRIFPLHFNHISLSNYKVKYSIVDDDIFINDLHSWSYLTLAGRLQKPTYLNVLNQSINETMTMSVQKNHENALKIGLLRLKKSRNKENVSLVELYSLISQLSYIGDIRYTFAVQNKNKVQNIVSHNLHAFNSLYLPILNKIIAKLPPSTLQLNQNSISIRFTPQLIGVLCDQLPFQIYQHLDSYYSNQKGHLTERILLSGLQQLPIEIEGVIRKINRKSSLRMAAYNFFGGSVTTNISYIWAKIKKRYFH